MQQYVIGFLLSKCAAAEQHDLCFGHLVNFIPLFQLYLFLLWCLEGRLQWVFAENSCLLQMEIML